MDAVLIIIGTIIIVFGAVVIVGPPYVPTLTKQMETALKMLDLKPGQTLLELGSGDGRVMKAAAKQGLNVVGIELNPFLVIISRIRCWKYRKQVTVIWDDLWKAKWPQADGIFTFMLQRQMEKLDKRITVWHERPVRLASFAFFIPDKVPRSKYNGIFLYEYNKKLTGKKGKVVEALAQKALN